MVTLSEADRRAYAANGYVTPRAPLPEQLFTRMRQGVQRRPQPLSRRDRRQRRVRRSGLPAALISLLA